MASPGWYENAGGPVRWWDGRHWTGLRVKDGVPGVDWWMTEPPALAWAAGIVFLVLGGFQLPLLVLPAMWFATAVPSTRVRRIPAPSTAPVAPDVVRPLPGEAEADGAGWYRLSSSVSRWWTGARWANYTDSRAGLRPTFHAPSVLRVFRVLGVSVFALGAAAIVVGAVLVFLGHGSDDGAIRGVGWLGVIGGLCCAGLGGLVVAIRAQQKKLLALPEAPPRGLTG
ncbi:hypothetical protein [Microbacterium sp. SORGH_AS_0888]|uniref:hypothetical protein n=1 Tax=Microbacterium sp. SORGH_AS_0888 TaxID=3041791 RepID=UPI00277D6D04|nr:hypothetical protein [Microbacterium sp. SORGH_AS_0888]MDQ1129192.1 hypothetical protein [Microbacterium sp. SORGH_AS_0888]